uniref:RGS domain-containing protein n=1 Tax=Graphocephala atropunctata TaxID=36148 RepID=A0A1B6KF06_9HEMI
MQVGSLTLISLLLLAGKPRSFVDSAALSLHPNSVDDLQSAVKSGNLRSDVDEDVRELHNLKPFTNNLISMQKSSSRVFSDVNGHKESHLENKQEVSQNGQKMGSFQVVADAKDVGNSATPATHVHAEVEVPAQGVHRSFDSANKRKAFSQSRVDPEDNMVDGYRSFTGVQYSPLDMAEYVFWTGDEKGVTLAIEEFLQDGMMTREEAIAFLQEIKVNLDYLQNHYAEERFQKQELAKERANQLQKAFNLEKMTEAKMSAPSELSEVRQQMRENLSKKNAEAEEAFSPSMSRMAASLTDDDYQDLLERLRVADFLYTEYSLEEVIYQLAKVMFSQSLTRGSSEAQEALQKFTGFLEAEAENGRISRSLEKKVLDVLIASLTDTLSEHPELVGAARAGLGSDLQDRNNETIEKLLLMNKAQQKQGLDSVKTGMANHRFQGAKGAAIDMGTMKKNVPTNQHPTP